ncbi:MAG: serine hydrolase, partial [Bacteroidia bacterium]|nr:serine hydrolase [Bacteroidia bacterium]
VPFIFGTQSLTASGIYTEVFTAASGCDSTVTLTFTVKPNVAATASAFICQGQTFVFGTQNLTASGIYTQVFTAANGCDSTVTLTLTVGSQIVNNIAETICAGETFAFNGQNLTASGEYTATLASAAGCDSVVNLTLTVNPVFNATDAAAVCANELPYVFGTQSLTAGGVYTETFTAANGCDSTVTLTLTVNPVFNVAVSQTIPAGTTLVFGTQTLSATGVYTETFQSAAGCDSVVTLTLTVAGSVDPAVVSALQDVIDANTPANGGITASVLRSDGSIATVFNGFAGIGTPVNEDIKFGTADITQHLLAVLTLRLAEEGILSLSDPIGTIPGATAAQVPASTTIGQALRHTSGLGNFAANPTYFSNALSPLFGNLTFDYGTVEYAPIFAFAGNAAAPGSFAYANTNFLALGQKLEALTGQSLQSLLNTYVLAPAGISGIEFFGVPVPAPVSQFYFNLSGLGEQALADQTSVLTSTGGSGSVVATPEAMAEYLRALFGGLILDPASVAQLTSFSPVTGRLGTQYGLGTEEFTLSIDGTDYDFIGHTGDVNYATALIFSPVLNEGAFVSANSRQVSEATVLEIARQLIRVSLNPAACPVVPVQTVVNAAICQGDSIAFGGQFFSAAGMYSDTLLTAAGCDSIAILKLTVLPAPPVNSLSIQLCADEAASVNLTVYEDQINTFVGQFTYTGIANPQNTAVADGQVVEVVYTSSANGCSAAATLTFDVNPVFSTTAAASVCADELPFTFGTQSLTAGGVYTEVFTASNGCDSTVTLTLTVNPVYNAAASAEVCANELPFVFGTQSLTAAGVYTEVFATASGCDSTVTLTLTVKPVFTATAAETITQGQAFVFGTQTLTAAGVYTEVFTASNGCDSTVTLTLTVLPATGIAAPTNLAANNGTAFLVPLSWNDNSNNETGFRIYRLGVLIATVGANVTTFSDTITIFGTPVTYFVEAFNATDVSSPSNTATYQMPAQFLQLDLTFFCYNPATDSLTWNVFNPNAQAHPYIFAQWWSPQRDTLVAWAGNSQFKTKRNAQSALTFGNDNITGIYYPIQNFQSLSDLVFTIPLNLTCSGIRQGYVPASGKGGKIFSGVLGSGMNTEANPNELLASVLHVSPNPFRSNVVLESEIPFEGRVRVFSAMGQLVKTEAVDLSAPVSIDLSNLAYGVYQLEVTSGNAVHVVKIVKQ